MKLRPSWLARLMKSKDRGYTDEDMRLVNETRHMGAVTLPDGSILRGLWGLSEEDKARAVHEWFKACSKSHAPKVGVETRRSVT